MTKREKFEKALYLFLEAGYKLIENWDEDSVTNYPEYLPSFDEFISQFAQIDEAK